LFAKNAHGYPRAVEVAEQIGLDYTAMYFERPLVHPRVQCDCCVVDPDVDLAVILDRTPRQVFHTVGIRDVDSNRGRLTAEFGAPVDCHLERSHPAGGDD
jgi:precorrin-6x reductase